MHAPQVLGIVGFELDEMRVYSETPFPTSRPVVDSGSGEVYWGNQMEIWKRGPLAGDRPVLMNRFPKELVVGRFDRLATHPTFSPDHRSLNLDVRCVKGDGTIVCYIGELPLDGSRFEVWQSFEGRHYNHAVFSPAAPSVQNRMRVIRKGEGARPVLRTPVSHSGHEWWDADGRHVCYVHYGIGVKRVDLAAGPETLVWPGALSHAHSDRSGRYLVADRMADPVRSDCHGVQGRRHRQGGRSSIVRRPNAHLHPYPQFCLHDRVDVAFVRVDELVRRTA